ncbi:gag-pol polyprotein [Cucumis melo var. makuwa]|uniref:Gag-pol polyprotein n=1 Tax=Cucumis melo var. makuwa TaxID=1194695 RepID=A0A5D3E1U9_CUCMM|nr:gag-pol polyprotein [Cucumis melo var. makuwa]
MEAFLMSLDMRSLRAIWTKDEDDAAVGNSRALNALFNGVDPNIFKLINIYKLAKGAWDILEVAFEGTSKVKISRLQILTSRFEALQMTEEETIVEFNVRVLDIANESDALEKKMSDSKLVRKVLRSLPSKFNMKKKSLVATFSDEEDYSESDDEEVRMALISISTINDEESAKVNSQASEPAGVND